MPELAHYITIGFNSTIRCLQDLARTYSHTSPASGAEANATPGKTVAAVFVCTSSSPAVLTSSFPTLVAAASARHPSDAPIRLVALPREAEKRLAEALFQPRVGFVGLLQDAPGGKALIDMAVDKVSPVEVSWLKADSKVEYMPVSIMTTSTFPNSG
jgi:ribonuclease P/MRP protein subunit POP3